MGWFAMPSSSGPRFVRMLHYDPSVLDGPAQHAPWLIASLSYANSFTTTRWWNIHNPEYSMEGLKRKLKLQYFGRLMWRANSLEKDLILGKIEGKRRRGQQRMMVRQHHWLNEQEFNQTPGDNEGQGAWYTAVPGGHKESDIAKQLNNY